MIRADRLSDFEIGRDKMVRDGGRCFVIDLKGVRAKIEVENDIMTPEFEANITKLKYDQKHKMIEAIRHTPYLSEEGRMERLKKLGG